MFAVSDLNKKYPYMLCPGKEKKSIPSKSTLDRANAHEVTDFINLIVKANGWEWNGVTDYSCKKIEFLMQEKLPLEITNKQDIYFWIIRNWNKYVFAEPKKAL